MKKILLVFWACALFFRAYAQCPLTLQGILEDDDHEITTDLSFRLIHDKDTAFIQTDSAGHFRMEGLCPGNYKFVLSEPDFEKSIDHFSLLSDTTLTIFVHRKNLQFVHEVTVLGKVNHSAVHTLATAEITGRELFNTRGSTLGEALKNIPGVNAIQSGPSIAKPVIHGMYGPRVLIVTNGIRLEGQSWAKDHAPELDPFIANNITVVKGAASVRYGADAEGGVVLMDPPALPTDNGLGGALYLVGASNGRSGTVSGNVQGALTDSAKDNVFSWRAQGTLKKGGNFKTPNYYLYNTGVEEGDFSLNASFRHRRWTIGAWYSQYHYKAGIFSGAESGNAKELLQKFDLAAPLTPDVFQYNIQKSYQSVTHNLLKTEASYQLENGDKWSLNWATQVDNRKEYSSEVIYNQQQANSGLPQVYFNLRTQTAELAYNRATRNNWTAQAGFSGLTQGNANTFTGVTTTLLPNFRSYVGGIFGIARYYLNNWTLEAGIRADYEQLNVYRWQGNSRYNYGNLTGTLGASYPVASWLDARFNSGIAWRAPSISEMFIKGTHLSDALYMLGDSTLKSERAWNNILSLDFHIPRLHIIADAYWNKVDHYIYAKPMPDPVILIGGAFLGFNYTQTNAHISGLDVNLRYDVLSWLALISKSSLVRGYDVSQHDYLIYMPADRFSNALEIHLPGLGKMQEPYCTLENIWVRHQNRFPAGEDFVDPPKGYALLNATIGCDLPLGKNKFSVSLSATNITNKAYRDYLDMFRYYNDALGSNYVLRLKYAF